MVLARSKAEIPVLVVLASVLMVNAVPKASSALVTIGDNPNF